MKHGRRSQSGTRIRSTPASVIGAQLLAMEIQWRCDYASLSSLPRFFLVRRAEPAREMMQFGWLVGGLGRGKRDVRCCTLREGSWVVCPTRYVTCVIWTRIGWRWCAKRDGGGDGITRYIAMLGFGWGFRDCFLRRGRFLFIYSLSYTLSSLLVLSLSIRLWWCWCSFVRFASSQSTYRFITSLLPFQSQSDDRSRNGRPPQRKSRGLLYIKSHSFLKIYKHDMQR